jgi:hypothetical protein
MPGCHWLGCVLILVFLDGSTETEGLNIRHNWRGWGKSCEDGKAVWRELCPSARRLRAACQRGAVLRCYYVQAAPRNND